MGRSCNGGTRTQERCLLLVQLTRRHQQRVHCSRRWAWREKKANRRNLDVGGLQRQGSPRHGQRETAGTLLVSDTTDATSSTTGALQSAGGLGVKLKAHIGGTLDVASSVSVTDATASTSITSGALKIAGGIGIEKAMFVGLTLEVTGAVTFSNNLDVTSDLTGSAIVKTTSTPTQRRQRRGHCSPQAGSASEEGAHWR